MGRPPRPERQAPVAASVQAYRKTPPRLLGQPSWLLQGDEDVGARQ